ncbi:SpaA isopeptide-forming pilin-related protein [Gemmiger formicilis]|uniref:SpaA isopeptide-forming pilin-related protein n=1 Tax=Gemmiger formicilis TaxID=745368 RepID=UPI0022E56514|nr:SpaA isopeptide-forming pilin-related protein [Gemmiger formicilis]
MNYKKKFSHRLLALALAAVMCCTSLPIGVFAETPPPQESAVAAEEQQTDETETDNGQTDASSPDPGAATEESAAPTTDESAEENEPYTFDGEVLYQDMPHAPTGSYIGSYGLPVATGETKIGLGAWDADLEQDSYLSAEALDSDNMTLAAPLLEDTDYAIVPILAQVEYPADGSSLDLILPDSVTLLDYYGEPAKDAESLLHSEYSETSAAALGVYVQADADFTAQLVYTVPDGSTLTKTLQVTIDRNATAEYPFPDSEIAAFAERPTPAVTSGKITKVAKVNSTWLIWFNGEPSYCCTHGAKGQPEGCPTYTYVDTSTVNADQCVPGDHYGNQIRIWGGLNQLSLGDADDLPAVFSADEGEEISLLDFCASIYDDVQMYIIENFPESTAAEIYLASANELLNGVETYASARGYYTYIYNPGRAGWQTVALIGPEIGEEEPEPEPVVQEYYASWEAPAQTASGSFDFSYGIRTDKIQLKTQEKVDGATIEIEPITKSGSIDGGSWSISPASKQTVTTSGHTADDNYQKNGGDASASWSLHYAVTKTSGTRNGQVGPFTTQEAADAAASSARDAAIAELQGEAQNAVNNAIAAAKAQLGSIQFRYEEITVPYGFGKYWGTNGSSQTISVPANTNNDYVMKNDEWSLQVNLKKTDSETGSQIAADAQYEIYQWDVVTGKYQPTGGYNTYSVQRQGDGSYAVINSAAYATTDAMRHTLYYTQRNQGKFILVETKAPAGYFGDWTDIDHPGTAGTPLGKRAYYIEITEANDNVVLWLDNADYNADILTADKGGTKLVTSGGVETTVSIYSTAKDSTRTYSTDNSGKAANEDSYTTTATDGVMKNDRTLGEISISKVDLDAAKYVENHGNAALDDAVYDLYAAEDITHPDGVTGVVDYSKIVDADGNPIWHTTIRDNSGQWVNDYLPILKKDHLVASAKIEDGWLTFANLYLGKYYVVERSTGTVIPLREGALAVSGTYPTVDSRTKAATGQVTALASSGGQYTDWVYKNQFSTITKGKALDGTATYDAYSLSFANGYLCDEHNYYITPAYADEGWYVEKTTFADDNTVYKANYHIHRDNAQTESQDQIAKGNVEISKIISSSGESNGQELENAGFTFYLVSDLSKAEQFTQSQTGAYSLQSILDCYLDKNYNNDHPKWDFSDEGQAVAKTYEVNAAEIAAYNKTLTAAGDNKNGKGNGWQPTGTANEYRLAEIFSNDTGNIRVQGLPYGTYLVVETTVPKNLYQAEPYLVVIDRNSPMSAMATPKDSEIVGSDSYQKFTVLDEQIEVYLRITKLDEETGKPVLLPGTAFQIYYLDDDGNYRMENGAPKLVRMTDTVNGHLTKNITTFYTNAEGILTLPEKLPLGKYRIVETTAPNGFYNEWLDEESHYVDFTITTDRIYQATGDKNENGMDTLVIGEKYSNHETLGKLTIRKTGEVLTGWQSAPDGIDPWMTGEAENGNFTYETRPLAGAEYTITAAEDIYTQDRQLDNYGNRTLWYAKGDVVAVVTTGDGTADTAVFAPARTAATYDFLSVIHDGTIGEVSVTLPLGSYHIAETKPPYGYVGTDASFDVTLAWDNQTQEIVAADAVEFHNEREKAKVGIYKTDLESGKYLAGAVFNLYTADDIYDADGSLVFAAGELVATSPETNADGYTYFDCDIPIRGEKYGSSTHKDATTNSGKYIVKEISAPLGYYVNEEPMEVTFTYDGEAVQVLESTCTDKPTEMWVSKRDLTNDEELPGATLSIKDSDGNVVESWVSTDTPHRVMGLHLGDAYTLTETRPADGYALADEITFRLLQKVDEDGSNLQEAEVYYLTTKNFLLWTWDDWKLLDDATVIMKDDITKVQISKVDIATGKQLPGAELTITDKDGKEIDRWVSTDKPHYIEKLPAGDYTLTEVKAPDGYAFAENVPFTVLPTGEVQRFEMRDDVIKVEISKVDITTNKELPGAELTLTDKDGKKIDRWVSTNTPHYIEKLPAGDYTLTEVKAPDGYAFAESVPFTVLPTGEVQRFEMRDDVIKVEISKVDITTNKELPGAELIIINKDGKVVEHWTSADKPHYIEKLPAGEYTLTEITAPNGYEIAEDISFTVLPTGEVQRVVMKDSPIPEQPVQPTPSSTSTPTPLIPQTGDTFPLGLLLALAGLSLAGLAALIYKCVHCKSVAQKDDDETE